MDFTQTLAAARSCSPRIHRKPSLVLPLLLLLFAPCVAGAQDLSDLDHIASDVANYLNHDSASRRAVPARVLILEFQNEHASGGPLGTELTEEFSDLLVKRGRGISLVTREEIDRTIAQKKLPDGLLADIPATRCFASSLGVDYYIYGDFDVRPSGAVVRLDILEAHSGGHIFEQEDIVVPLTDAQRGLASKPSLPVTPIVVHDDTV